MQLVCIVCPNGCLLNVEKQHDDVVVHGAKCRRGEDFAKTEVTCPMRSLTTSIKTTLKNYPVVSVKTDGEIPKDKVMDVVNSLSQVTLETYLPIGAMVVENVLGLGVNVILTTQMEENNE